MEGEKLIALLLRIATAAAVATPFAVYYTSSGSLENFLTPKTEFRMPNLKLDVTYFNVSERDSGYALDLGLLNTGSVVFGLKELEGRVFLVDQGFAGGFALESPIVLAPGREGGLRVLLLLERGDLKALEAAVSSGRAFNVTGRATVVVGDTELPFTFTLELNLSEVGGK